MRRFVLHRLSLITLIHLWFIPAVLWGQTKDFTSVRGIVTDSLTGEPIVMASIFLPGPNVGCSTDEKGFFYISTRQQTSTVRISAVGYTTQELAIKSGKDHVLRVAMVEKSVELGELVVKRKKDKYSKRDNPAVALARKLIARRGYGDPLKKPYYSYTKYERVTYGLDNFVADTVSNRALDRYHFLNLYTDTIEASGRRVLPVSIRESVSRELHANGKHQEIVEATSNEGVDKSIDQESINRFIGDMLGDIDLFANDIAFIKNRFVSPLSNIGVSFYKYYLGDTVDIDGDPCVELSFVPFETQGFGFMGRLWVTIDSTLFIKKALLNVPRAINLNWVSRVFIEQDYQQMPDGTRLKMREDMTVEFSIMSNLQGLYMQRITTQTDHSFLPIDADLVSGNASKVYASDARHRSESYWTKHRPKAFKSSVSKMHQLMTEVRKDWLYYWGEKLILASIHHYYPTRTRNSKIDVGPVTSIISYNKLEGLRLKFGAMTTAHLNAHWFARAHVAYGFKDHKLKYLGELAYSFKPKELHSREFPIHGFTLTHQYDLERLGQNFVSTSADNSLLAITRKPDDKLAYLRTTALTYQYESHSGFSVLLSLHHYRHEASHLIDYCDGLGNTYYHYDQAGVTLTLRYAPGEKFMQGRLYRFPINIDRPIFTLTHIFMPRSLTNSLYNVNKTLIAYQQRWWFSAFGYADVLIKGEKVWGTVGYPDLILPAANLSYTIQPETFALLDVMEFALDQCLMWDVEYNMNGLLFNRIPLLKKLKWREVLACRGAYGSRSSRNDPDVHSDLLRFPDGTLCLDMRGKPYIEAGFAIDNIFRLLRLDFVWRLTHRDTPDVDRWGVRASFHMNF